MRCVVIWSATGVTYSCLRSYFSERRAYDLHVCEVAKTLHAHSFFSATSAIVPSDTRLKENKMQISLYADLFFPVFQIHALPSSKGYISARGSARCVLTWHRAEGFVKKGIQTKLVLYVHFMDSQRKHIDKRTATRLVGWFFILAAFHLALRPQQNDHKAETTVSMTEWCEPGMPPVQQLMLDAENALPDGNSPRDRLQETDLPVSSAEIPSKTSIKRVTDELLDWLCSQSQDTVLTIILCGVVIYSMGVADSYTH
ncbi:unnamed protein product [Toxocara canis]|uniref:Solute carrier family 34 member 2 n=1 Tax=Toxocara canis TaxID=6265 RepID=A0A183VAN2_TOXCA|nr:unnamed protein product [Toxocara canis]